MNHHLDFNINTGGKPQDILPPLPSPAYKDIKVLLASNSPRRRELLGMIMPTFDIAVKRDISEHFPSDLAPEKVPVFLSMLKADAYADLLAPDELIITADTVVILDGNILGKPTSTDDAVSMLQNLRGKTHTVVTGVTLTSLTGKKRDTFSEATDVTFGNLTDEEIRIYVERYSPLDKAGAYGIQEWIGATAIESIRGCFYNVMGLPLNTLYKHLKDFF